MFISVVGPIGAGKSTLIKSLGLPNVLEATDKWNKSGILEKFYEDPTKYAFAFQLAVFNDYVDNVQRGLHESPNLLVSERSIFCQPLFWELQPKQDVENDIYQALWQKWRQLIPEPTHYIFLDTDNVDELLARINKRARPGEQGGISSEYEQSVIQEHKKFYTKERFGDRLIILNALDSIEENVAKIKQLLKF